MQGIVVPFIHEAKLRQGVEGGGLQAFRDVLALLDDFLVVANGRAVVFLGELDKAQHVVNLADFVAVVAAIAPAPAAVEHALQHRLRAVEILGVDELLRLGQLLEGGLAHGRHPARLLPGLFVLLAECRLGPANGEARSDLDAKHQDQRRS